MTGRTMIACAALLLSANVVHAQGTATPQTSPRMRRIVEITDLIRAADEGKLLSYLQSDAAPELLARKSAAELTQELLRAGRDLGSFQLGGIQPVAPGVARAAITTGSGEAVQLTLGIEQAEPYRIVLIEFAPAAGGSTAAGGSPSPSAVPNTPDPRRDGPSLPPPAIPLSRAQAAAHLTEYVKAAAEQSEFSGAVMLAHEGRAVFRGAAGMANRAVGEPNSPATLFSIGSINKMFTAVGIAQLVEQGKLSFGDPLSRFLPDFPNRRDAQAIRIEHLLTHTSGLGNYFNQRFMLEQPRSVAHILDIAREDTPLAFAPGTSEQYSNTGYAVLGAIIEAVSKQSYYDFVKRNILEPSGMTHTLFPEAGDTVPGAAVRYSRASANQWQASGVTSASPAGSALSTVDDLVRFAEALRTGRLVSQATLDRMMQPRPDLGAAGYGFGMSAATQRPRTFGHNGGSPGVHAHLQIFPDDGYSFVMLTNQTLSGTPASNQYMVNRLTTVTNALIGSSR